MVSSQEPGARQAAALSLSLSRPAVSALLRLMRARSKVYRAARPGGSGAGAGGGSGTGKGGLMDIDIMMDDDDEVGARCAALCCAAASACFPASLPCDGAEACSHHLFYHLCVPFTSLR